MLIGPAVATGQGWIDVGAARDAHLLGGSGGIPRHHRKVWILDHLRSFLVQSWDEISRVGQCAAIMLETFNTHRI